MTSISHFDTSHFDTSTQSVVLGITLLIAIYFSIKYIIENYSKTDETRVYLYSTLSSVLATIFILFMYTKFLKQRGANNFDTGGFN